MADMVMVRYQLFFFYMCLRLFCSSFRGRSCFASRGRYPVTVRSSRKICCTIDRIHNVQPDPHDLLTHTKIYSSSNSLLIGRPGVLRSLLRSLSPQPFFRGMRQVAVRPRNRYACARVSRLCNDLANYRLEIEHEVWRSPSSVQARPRKIK
jgi:hypothetical protein